MKRIFSLALLVIFLSPAIALAQCNPDDLCNACIPKLSTGFNFVESYRVHGQQSTQKVEYSYVFTQGTQYMITVCEQQPEQSSVVVTIYDAQRNKVATNKIDGNVLSAIAYPCHATGIYYLQYTFEEGSQRCAGSALGFK